jgi:hypothetical protein
LAITTSFRTLRHAQPVDRGQRIGNHPQHHAHLALLHKALTRKRPMPGGEMAKLHSLVRSNSAICLSFMIERASASVCAPCQRLRRHLGDLAVHLHGGRKVAVMNKSLPLRLTT